jgi:hypothetical protein
MKSKKPSQKIKHQITEVKEYVFPIFFSFMTLFFLFGISLAIIDMENSLFSLFSIPIIWILWIWVIIKNDLWRPKKVKYVEHIIIEDKMVKKVNKVKHGRKKYKNM